MADDESWLYGEEDTSEAPVVKEEEEEEVTAPPTPAEVPDDDPPEEDVTNESPEAEESEDPQVAENGDVPEARGEDPEEEEEDDDSDDDGFRITIDQNKIEEAKSSYNSTTPFGVKNRPSLTEKKGKFSVEEMDQVGTVNGLPAHELDMESLEEKPWKKPGADITDYFNYGFTEETWQAYCNRQRKMRVGESGVGMPGLNNSIVTNKVLSAPLSSNLPFAQQNNSIPTLGGGPPVPGVVTSAPPPIPKAPVMPLPVRAPPSPLGVPPAPSSIAVMTHDKREYSKKVISEIDFSVPPPGMGGGIPTVGGGAPANVNLPPPPIPHHIGPGGGADFPTEDPFEYTSSSYTGYEPTMEAQWTAPPGDRDYDDRDWNRSRRNREERRGDYERKRRRSRSRSRDRYRERRDRRRSRSKSPGGYKHKKSKKEKKERKQEESVKREPEDRVD